jgi:hypothetical protein
MTTTRTAHGSPGTRKMVRDNATRVVIQRFAPRVPPPPTGRQADWRANEDRNPGRVGIPLGHRLKMLVGYW